jgi:hypothetical protein
MTPKDAYAEAGRKKKGLILSGVIGGRQKEQRLLDYIEKHASMQCEITAETTGFVIVTETGRR